MESVLLAASKTRYSALILLLLVLNFLGDFRSGAQVLPDEEVQALREIGRKMGIGQWMTATPNGCKQELNATVRPAEPRNGVVCDCNSTLCHVVSIELRLLNLHGELPEEFANLTFLSYIVLNRNYLNGSIPRRWASLPLRFVGLLGNRISGTIPREFGSVATLEELVLNNNIFGGSLPPELGNLSRLKRMLLAGNNFTGELPDTFGNLRNLTDFRIDGSYLSGRMPEFIGNWTELQRLDMQGTSLEGPIPSSISLLTKLTELRISDLRATKNIPFPNLENLTSLTELTLRNCSMIGSIPLYIGERMINIQKLREV